MISFFPVPLAARQVSSNQTEKVGEEMTAYQFVLEALLDFRRPVDLGKQDSVTLQQTREFRPNSYNL